MASPQLWLKGAEKRLGRLQRACRRCLIAKGQPTTSELLKWIYPRSNKYTDWQRKGQAKEDQLRASAEQRARIANRIKELQPEAADD